MGITKLVTSLEALTFSLTHFIVTGSVALEELVEKAVTIAEAIARKCFNGFILTKRINISGVRIRNLLISGKKIPNILMRKKISKTLSYNSMI